MKSPGIKRIGVEQWVESEISLPINLAARRVPSGARQLTWPRRTWVQPRAPIATGAALRFPLVARLFDGTAFLAGLLFVGELPAVNLPPIWRWSNPSPHGANIVDQAANSALTVQVGERGQIYLSDDWTTWAPRDSYTTAALRGATFLNGRLVLSGEAGTIMFADDPWNFHGLNLGTADWLESAAASDSLVVAVGDSAAIYTSTNAVNWQRITPTFTNWLRSVACRQEHCG